MQQYPIRFLAAYAAIGAIAIAALVGFVVVMVTPVTPVAHKSDVRAALGATDTKQLLTQAENKIAAEASSSGLTLTKQEIVSVSHPDKNTVVLKIRVVTAQYGPQVLKATFHKGIYSLADLEAA